MGNLKRAGAFLFIGIAQFAIFLIVAEALFPNYSVANNYISDLGTICGRPPASANTCVRVEPSATIFNSSIIILGIFVLVASYFLIMAKISRMISILAIIAGIGMVGVGAFPEGTALHGVFSLITFLFIGLFAIFAYSIQRPPMNYFSIIAGIATLLALVLFITQNYLGLGVGGMERMIVYPVMSWGLAFAGYLMGLEEIKK